MSPIVWNMCGNLQYESVYFKELHKDQDTIDRQHREGAAVVSTITSCQRGNRAQKRGCLGGSFIIP